MRFSDLSIERFYGILNCHFMEEQQSPIAILLRNRSFLFLWIGQILSQFAGNMLIFLLGLLTYKNTGSNTAVSGLFIAWGVPSVLFGMLAGIVVDKLDKRKIIIMSSLVRALLVIGLLLVMQNVVFVYIIIFLSSMISQFFIPAEAALIPRFVKGKEILTANSMFSFAYYSSMAIGFILAGPMLRLFGPTTAIVVLSSFFLIAAWMNWYLPKMVGEEEDTAIMKRVFQLDVREVAMKVIRLLREGISYVWSSHVLFDSLILLTGTQIMIAILSTLGPGFADRIMGIPVDDASLYIIGPVVAGVLVGSYWVGNKGVNFAPKKLIRIGIVSAGAILIAISVTVYLKRFLRLDWLFADSIIIPIEIGLFFLLGVANSLLDVPANSILQKNAEGDMRGRVYGLLSVFVGGVGVLPVLAGGVLSDLIGVGKVIFILGFLILTYGIIRIRKNGHAL